MIDDLEEIVQAARAGSRLAPHTVFIDETTARQFVAMRIDPRRFTPAIFDGEWADVRACAAPGDIMIVAAVACAEDVVRVLGRQEGKLYALTWKQLSESAKMRRRSRRKTSP